MRVFVHNVASPEEAVARFTDGCLDGVEVTVLAVPHHKNHAVFVKKPSGVVIIVTSKAPYEITGWFEAENIDDDFHKRGAGWLVKRSDPIFRHPKELLDEYHRA